MPLLALAVLAPIAFQEPAEEPRVILESLDGTIRVLPLEELDAGSPADLGAALVRFAGLPSPAAPGGAEAERLELHLTTGDRLVGRLIGGRGESVHIALAGQTVLPVSIDLVDHLVFPDRLPPSADLAREAPESGDRLLRNAGGELDRSDGAVDAFGDEGVRFDSERVGMRTFAWTDVAALFVEMLDEPPAREPSEHDVVVDLLDGTRLRGRCVELDAEGLDLRIVDGLLVELPLDHVVEIVRDDGRLAFLSELAPSLVDEGSPFGDDLGMVWPHRVDANVRGGPLRALGRTYARGLGVHAPSRLGWDLGGAWSELRVACAIDDDVLVEPARGSVVFRIHVDGELRWESGVVRGGDPPVSPPRLSLEGANELVLEVDASEDFFVADRADWLRPVLIR